MRLLITAGFLFGALFIFTNCAHASAFNVNFPNNLYDEAYPRESKDHVLKILVDGETTNVDIHPEAFRSVKIMYDLFSEHKWSSAPFKNKAEASAFKKVLYFLYKNTKPDLLLEDPRFEGFFEAFDLPALILDAWKYKIDALSHAIAFFLHEQVERKLKNPYDSIWLDRFTHEEFQYLYHMLNKVDQNIYKNDPQAKSIRVSIDYYAHLMFFYDRPRAGKILVDPQIHKQIADHKEEIQIQIAVHKKEAQEARAREALERQAQTEAQSILEKLGKDLLTKGSCSKLHTYWVPRDLRDPVMAILTAQLPDYDVSTTDLDHCSWTSDLCSSCSEPCTPASCLARGAGWLGCAILYPLQLLTFNCCICCYKPQCHESDWLCGTHSGQAIACCVYNTATACSSAIFIKPKKLEKHELRLPPLPPVEEQEMRRGEAEDV